MCVHSVVVGVFSRYVYDRFMKLGGELSAAVFLVHRGAAVRFHGRDKWFAADPDSYTYDLPSTFVRDWNIEAIDMRDFHIIHKGFENLAHCEKLRSLALRNQPYVDDWCLDFISAVFHSTLEFLDVSGCANVTENGLSVLHRCRNLRGLYMRHMPKVRNAELLAIHLEDVLPNVIIEGVDYWNAASPENWLWFEGYISFVLSLLLRDNDVYVEQ